MRDLNEEQKNAVLSTSPAVAVIAGPGTGKTKTLIAKIEFLLNSGVSPSKILALTFTNRAASEMKSRLKSSSKKSLPFVGTFHALSLHLLDRQPKIITKKEQLKYFSQKQLNKISLAKNNLKHSDLVKKYNEKLRELDLIDYDDLLINLYHRLEALKLKLDTVLVDEFQDTSPLQYKIMKKLHSKNYFVIGDPKQSIYSFRATQSKVFKIFEKDFKAEVNILTKNYRSSQKIVDTFESLFPESSKLKTDNLASCEVFLLETPSEFSEADWITQNIKLKAGGIDLRDASDALSNYSDFAVIYRTHRFKETIEKRFRDLALPYQVVGGGSIFEDEEIQNVIEMLKAYRDKEVGLIDQINKISENLEIANDKRQDLKSVVHRFGNDKFSINNLLDYVDSLKQKEYYDSDINCVTLLTMHASKGLEFEHVFVCGLEENIIPHRKSDIEEEKRLLYVAMSRAKNALYLTKAISRHGVTTSPSQFLKLLNIEKIEDERAKKKEDRIKKYKLKKAQMGLF